MSDLLKHFIRNENQKKFNQLETWKLFADRSKKHSYRFKEIVYKLSKEKLLGYGASARSSTLLNYCKISNNEIEFIFDLNNLKTNKYTPGAIYKYFVKRKLVSLKGKET